MVILRVILEVLRQMLDPLGQNGDLDLAGSSVGLMSLEFCDQLLLVYGSRHCEIHTLS